MSVAIALAALTVAAVSLALSLWSLKTSKDADLNSTVAFDDALRRAYAEKHVRD